jgi:hypothetical protein
MNEFLKYYGIFVIILLCIVGGGAFEESHVWSEQGTISWVGQKTFVDNNGVETFVIPFAVTVPIHGTFNFTTSSNGNSLCGNAQYNAYQTPFTKGTVVGLVKLQCGGFDLVIDP